MNTQTKTQLTLSPSGGTRRVASGGLYQLELAPVLVDILQLEDVAFGLDREVFLPVPPDFFDHQPKDAPGDLTGLDAIRATLEFAQTHLEKQLLVVGHTDTSGSDEHNLKLSARRAESVQLYLQGDRAGWAAHARDNDEVADLQTVLKWVAQSEGWPTDPGDVDGIWGDKTSGARRGFRRLYNELLDGSLKLDGKQSVADWEAFFDCYDRDLCRRLRIDAAGLAQLRSSLYFVGDGRLGCGEHWPVESLGLDDLACASNRRVELLWFDADEVVDLGGERPGQFIYGGGRYQFEPVPVNPTDPTEMLHYQVRAILMDHFHTQRLANKTYRLRGPLPEFSYDRFGTTDLNGRLQEDELPAGDYYLEVEGTGIVVGTHFEFAEGEPDDLYRLALPHGSHVPDSPKPYDDPWLLYAEEDADDDFADAGVDPYEPDDPELDDELEEILEDDEEEDEPAAQDAA